MVVMPVSDRSKNKRNLVLKLISCFCLSLCLQTKYIYLVYTAKHTIFIEKNMVHPSSHTNKIESKKRKDD